MHRRHILALLGTFAAGCVSPPSAGQPPLDGEPCPALDPQGGPTACYHTAPEADVALVPARTEVALGETTTFRLENRRAEEVSFGPYYWAVWRERATGWKRLDGDRARPDLGAVLGHGDSHEWRVDVDRKAGETGGTNVAASGVAFDRGRYAFGVTGVRGGPASTYLALFDVV